MNPQNPKTVVKVKIIRTQQLGPTPALENARTVLELDIGTL